MHLLLVRPAPLEVLRRHVELDEDLVVFGVETVPSATVAGAVPAATRTARSLAPPTSMSAPATAAATLASEART
jgi:hypothetical protein